MLVASCSTAPVELKELILDRSSLSKKQNQLVQTWSVFFIDLHRAQQRDLRVLFILSALPQEGRTPNSRCQEYFQRLH